MLKTEITKRKSTKRAILKWWNKGEQVKNWYVYFKEPVGKPPKITDEKVTVTTILGDSDLNIKASHFTTNSEYEQVRKQIKENKVPGPHGIRRQVLKWCKTNNIIINFASNILNVMKNPDNWEKMIWYL